jgi:hypothetical protein
MARFQADVQKVYQGEYWTNRYILEAADLAAATLAAHEIVDNERNIHSTLITFDKLRVSSVAEGDQEYAIESLTGNGEYNAGVLLVPLFNVVRVDFNCATGRPSRKYLRGCIGNENQVGPNLLPAYWTIVGTSYVTLMLNVPGFVDVDGQPFTSGVTMQRIGMRQLRRGRRKREAPVI